MNFAQHRTGFTLIETALALLAISLGLLGIFGIARHGLKAGGDTQNETRCTMLADTMFATLKAKNDELAARKTSLEDWWFYWARFASGTAQTVICLPPMPEIFSSIDPIRIALGEHNLNDYLAPSATVTEIKWNPKYVLTLTPNGINMNLESITPAALSQALENGQIDVTLNIHPGFLQSGADWKTYDMVLTYTGGLP